MSEPSEPAVEEPEFSEERIAEMRQLNTRARVVDDVERADP